MIVRPRAFHPVAPGLALALALVACGGGDGAELQGGDRDTTTTSSPAVVTTLPATTVPAPGPGPGPGPTVDVPGTTVPPPPPPPPRSALADLELRLTRVAQLAEPVAMAVRPDDGALYVAERKGKVRAVRGGNVASDPVLDLSDDVGTNNADQGLLGMTFSPDGGRLYVLYVDGGNDTHVVEFAMGDTRADPRSRRELLFVEQPFAGNKGGGMAFGPDGRLWIGLGDGGGGGDPRDNAQNLGTLLGKLLRIDPRPDIGAPYTIPLDNPFLRTPGARPEIWAYGLRNPWRLSFDRATGDLWVGDIGQNARDEVDFLPAGAGGGQNYGWARLEGTRRYSGTAPSDAVDPLFDYGRGGGNCGIVGGYVYRGARIPALVGAYVYADRCVGRLQALVQEGGRVVDQRSFNATVRSLVSFGQDGAGELYALSLDGGVFRIEPT